MECNHDDDSGFNDELLAILLQYLQSTDSNQKDMTDQADLDLALEYVQEEVDNLEVRGAVQVYIQDEKADGWHPASPASTRPSTPSGSAATKGSPTSPQPGPSGLQSNQAAGRSRLRQTTIDQQGGLGPMLPESQEALPSPVQSPPYTFRLQRERTFANNAAVSRTYQVRFNDTYQGMKLKDLSFLLRDMFADVLIQARGDLQDTDLCVIIINHPRLNAPIIISLQSWGNISVDSVMDQIAKVLNSNEELTLDESFEITVGTIALPKGGKRRKITSLSGENCSLDLKKSVITIDNVNDQLCLARSIAVVWAKLVQCSDQEWRTITSNRAPEDNNVDLCLCHRKVSKRFYANLINKTNAAQKNMALELCRRVGHPTDRPGTLNDIEAFEDLLNIRVLVISATHGNKFIRVGSNDHPARPHAYLYLVDDNHFHAITSITGFLGSSYFCTSCLKPYNTTSRHNCQTACIVCKSNQCPNTDNPIKCEHCNMTCRSQNCFDRHRILPKPRPQDGFASRASSCQRWWKCSTCFKVIDRQTRDLTLTPHTCNEYYCPTCRAMFEDHRHHCYQKANPIREQPDNDKRFLFFDFECSQDQTASCDEGYLPGPPCQGCTYDTRCSRCRRCTNCLDSWCGRPRHLPNYCVTQTACKSCLKDEFHQFSRCDSCGSRCPECSLDREDLSTGKKPCQDTCGFRQVKFSGPNTLDDFGKWLFHINHRYTTAIAHNMKGYDGVFLLQYLLKNTLRPDKIIYQGSKITYMAIKSELHIRILDSLSFLPMPLKALTGAFGMEEKKKGYFPHFFNTEDHQDYVGPYPSTRMYGADYMSTQERNVFMEWYDAQKGHIFNFRREMMEYCVNDVTILRQACMQFRDMMLEITQGQVDPFTSVTIASCCMNVYKTLFMEENYLVKNSLDTNAPMVPAKRKGKKWSIQEADGRWRELKEGETLYHRKWIGSPIAQVPSAGYVRRDQYSKESIQWLEWIMHTQTQTGQPLHIVHALNGGEHRVPNTNFYLDGYNEDSRTAFEFHGCIYHGCRTCYPDDRTNVRLPKTKQSVEELFALTVKKEQVLKEKGYTYVGIWEHDFKKQLQQNPEMKAFTETLDLTERLDPRDSFFGGRTNGVKLHHKAKPDERIRYVDFTSLYPWTNKTARYPVGHPQIIYEGFDDIQNYFGMAKTKILPPKGLYHPVLPYRSKGKLKFPLCRACADEELLAPCRHTDAERAITGTWCTPEIAKAIEMGYTVLKVYEVYHWAETSQLDPGTKDGGLFADYVNTFLKIKQESSGWPAWCKTEEDRQHYVKDYYQKEGILLDPQRIGKNPGLRSLAKLMLNSFWGKFGQRLNLRQSAFLHRTQLDEFYKMLTDPHKEVKFFHIISNDYLQLEWVHRRNDFLPEDQKTNIFLASFTTCWARLKLYSVLERLGERVLYFDTDSVVYISKPGFYDPPLGDYLGELTDELDGAYITEFVSGGPKNYAYRTSKGKEVCKVKGFSLNHTNSQMINFESIKGMVTNVDPKMEVTFRPVSNRKRKERNDDPSTESKRRKTIDVCNSSKICRNKQATVLYNRPETKSYRIVYTKRVIQPDLTTLPFGF